jgi:hypothetical protein
MREGRATGPQKPSRETRSIVSPPSDPAAAAAPPELFARGDPRDSYAAPDPVTIAPSSFSVIELSFPRLRGVEFRYARADRRAVRIRSNVADIRLVSRNDARHPSQAPGSAPRWIRGGEHRLQARKRARSSRWLLSTCAEGTGPRWKQRARSRTDPGASMLEDRLGGLRAPSTRAPEASPRCGARRVGQ